MKSPSIDQTSFPGFSVIFCFCRLRLLRVSLKLFPETFTHHWLIPPWSGYSDSVISSKQICCSIRDWENKLFTLLWTLMLLLHWAFERGLPTLPKFSSSSMSAAIISPFQIPLATNAYPNNIPGNTLPNCWSLDWSLAEIGWCSTIAPNGMTGPFTRFSDSPFIRCFPIRQEILNISQIARAFHEMSPPLFNQAWLQWYRRRSFFYFAYCSLSNIPFVSDRWRGEVRRFRDKSSQDLPNSNLVVCVNDFRLFRRLETLS